MLHDINIHNNLRAIALLQINVHFHLPCNAKNHFSIQNSALQESYLFSRIEFRSKMNDEWVYHHFLKHFIKISTYLVPWLKWRKSQNIICPISHWICGIFLLKRNRMLGWSYVHLMEPVFQIPKIFTLTLRFLIKWCFIVLSKKRLYFCTSCVFSAIYMLPRWQFTNWFS